MVITNSDDDCTAYRHACIQQHAGVAINGCWAKRGKCKCAQQALPTNCALYCTLQRASSDACDDVTTCRKRTNMLPLTTPAACIRQVPSPIALAATHCCTGEGQHKLHATGDAKHGCASNTTSPKAKNMRHICNWVWLSPAVRFTPHPHLDIPCRQKLMAGDDVIPGVVVPR